MPPKGKKLNLNKSKKTSDLLDAVTIESLNDDQLVSIFENLIAKDRLKIESVSKRWNRLSKLSWTQMKSFNVKNLLPYNPFEPSNDDKIKEMKTNFLVNILNRSSQYLNKLYISDMKTLNYERFLKELPQHCKNITYLEVGDQSEDIKLLNDNKLKDLFNKTMNLSSISLQNLFIKGDCLLPIPSDNIKEVSIGDCLIESKAFFSNLKNLNKLEIYYDAEIIEEEKHVPQMNEILSSLNKCENLEEVKITARNGICFLEKLPSFLSKQKMLKKLTLSNIEMDENLINSIQINNLKELQLEGLEEYLDDIKKFLKRFENVEIFTCYFNKMDSKDLQLLLKSLNSNVQEIHVHFWEYDLLKKLKLDFNRFSNLETFGLYDETAEGEEEEYGNINHVLKEISNYKNLKNLIIYDCMFNNTAFKHINNLTNLITLELSPIDRIDIMGGCKELFNKLKYLKEFKIKKFNTINDFSDFTKMANKIKLNRGDKNKLKIISDIGETEINWPLISHAKYQRA